MSHILNFELKYNLEKIPNIFPYYYQHFEYRKLLKKKSLSGLVQKLNFTICRTMPTNPKPHPKIGVFQKDRPKIDQE